MRRLHLPEDLDPTWIPYIRDINSYEIRRKNAWLRRSEDVPYCQILSN